MGEPFPLCQFEEDMLQTAVHACLTPQGLGSAAGNDPARLYNGDLVTYLLRHFKRMGGHEHGSAPPGLIPEDILYQPCSLRIQSHHGFIHNEQ